MFKVLLLILIGNSCILSFPLLIDNFTEQTPLPIYKAGETSPHYTITKGTDFVGKVDRFFNSHDHIENWSFLLDGGISFLNQSASHEIGYSFHNSMKFSDIERLKFTLSHVPVNNTHRLMLYDDKGAFRGIEFKFESTDRERFLDFNEIKQNNQFYDYAYSPGATFNEDSIGNMVLEFNYQGNEANDCILDSIEIVPEPFSVTMLGAGVLKFIRRKGYKYMRYSSV